MVVPHKSIGKFAYGGIIACLSTLLFVGALSLWNHFETLEHIRMVEHTNRMLLKITDLLAAVQDVETGSRGFVLTGDMEYLAPFDTAKGEVDAILTQLRKDTSDNPYQQQYLDSLEPLVHAKVLVQQEIVDARRDFDLEAARQIMLTGRGKANMDEIRNFVSAMNAEELRLMELRDQAVGRSTQITMYVLSTGIVLILLTTTVVTIRMRRDLEARERAEKAAIDANHRVAEQAEILTSVLRCIGDGVVVADSSGKFVIWNPAATRLVGHGAVDLPPDRWTETYGVFLPDKKTPCPVERLPLMRAIRGESVDNDVLYLKNEKLAEGRWLSITARPLTDATGNIRGGVVVFNDISERKSHQEALQDAHDLLEMRVDERTAELARSNKELEQFAYVASHDLQQPLRMVTSYVQLLEKRYKDQLDADAGEFIDYAVQGTLRMKRLINDLLTYSRVGTRGQDFTPTNCDLVLEHTLRLLDVAIQESGASITHDPLPTVIADETQLIQLFQNLIDNAIKYRNDRLPVVHVGAKRDGNDWVFSVRDNGIGIDKQYADRIFLIFQRLHGKTEYSGTGIGLAVCKKVVERHGGRLWMESKPGEGATFYFTIPYKEIPNDESDSVRKTDRDLVGGGRTR